MIKEKKKKSKYNFHKTKKQILIEYIRTIFVSVLIAMFVTAYLANKARDEMLSNLYQEAAAEQHMDKQTALALITQNDLLKDLQVKKYGVCFHIGELYEAAGDYKDAQMAYEFAVQKAKPGVYKAHYRLICVLLEQRKFKEADDILDSIKDFNTKSVINFKTRANIVIGDKYYSIGKFLSAGKSYERAYFYYSKFKKRDSKIEESIKNRIINSYIQTSDVMVKTGLNSDAVRYLKKAENYDSENFNIRYKLAIILADLDPELSVKYFEKLLDEIPQDIDYGAYGHALMKAANIADLDGRPTQAKYYRYKIHSADIFVARKVVYKNDIDVELDSFKVKKNFFTYPLSASYRIYNVSSSDIIKLDSDFVLCINGEPVETVSLNVANKNEPLFLNSNEGKKVDIKFNRKILTKKELENYTVKIYLYKDSKYKTLVTETKIPQKSIKSNYK